jgi:hypothetical protein
MSLPRSLVPLVLLFGSCCAYADSEDICGTRWVGGGTVFSLMVERSFDPGVTFKLCDREDHSKRFLLISTQSGMHSEKWVSKTLPLDPSRYDKVVALYERALDYDVKDDSMGMDGSSWCLETRRGFTYSKACFWTPQYETKKRRLSGLLALGEELWRVAKLDSAKLY